MSTFSTALGLELIANGDQAGTWGTTTNTNIGTLLEQAITGVGAIALADVDYSLTKNNGSADESRNAVLVFSGTLTVTRTITLPAVNKTYIVYNGATKSLILSTGSGPTTTLASGYATIIYCTGGAGGVVSIAPTKISLNVITSATGSEIIPSGSTAQRDALPSVGYFRYNTSTDSFEGVRSYAGATVSSITKSIGTPTATVNSTAHGLTTGAIVIVTGASDALYNGEFSIVYVTDDQFTYTMTTEPGANASGTLAYTVLIWGNVGGGATGAAGNDIFYENSTNVTANYTLTTNKNAMSAGPITVNTGITVTVPTSSTWSIV